MRGRDLETMAQRDRLMLALQMRFSQHRCFALCGGRMPGNGTYPFIVQEEIYCPDRYRRHACIGGRAHPCA
jgi:hypothetical protein